jgi:hypothetical protein
MMDVELDSGKKQGTAPRVGLVAVQLFSGKGEKTMFRQQNDTYKK